MAQSIIQIAPRLVKLVQRQCDVDNLAMALTLIATVMVLAANNVAALFIKASMGYLPALCRNDHAWCHFVGLSLV
tara:strand:- start:42420 stop:42644 length:225 start_codon:yes stop_codon:yes gene_type:complete